VFAACDLTGKHAPSEQDNHLDQLSGAITRQKEIGLLISEELDLHADLLDTAETTVEVVNRRLLGARQRLDAVSKHAKDKSELSFLWRSSSIEEFVLISFDTQESVFIMIILILILIIIIVATKVR
jgi:hypothetical protein